MAESINYIGTMKASKLGGPIEQYSMTSFVNKTLARAYKAAPDQAINHNAAAKVAGYTESWDIGGNFASDKFVAPVSGYYHVTGSIFFTDAESKLNYCSANVYLNGVERFRLGSWEGTDKAYIAINGSDDVYLIAAQYLELYGFILTSDGSAAVMTAGHQYTYLAVHLIST
jgi:hypothetical protein